MKLFIHCGGADDPRPVKMRQRGSDNKWFYGAVSANRCAYAEIC